MTYIKHGLKTAVPKTNYTTSSLNFQLLAGRSLVQDDLPACTNYSPV